MAMRHLPLRRSGPAIVAKRRARGDPSPVVITITAMPVMVMMVVRTMMMMVIAMHQKATGLSMISRWRPSVPCATMEPSVSTTSLSASRAVMSEVS